MSDPLRQALRAALAAGEAAALDGLIPLARMPEEARGRVAARAARLVEGVRGRRTGLGDLDAFLHEYRLSTQ